MTTILLIILMALILTPFVAPQLVRRYLPLCKEVFNLSDQVKAIYRDQLQLTKKVEWYKIDDIKGRLSAVERRLDNSDAIQIDANSIVDKLKKLEEALQEFTAAKNNPSSPIDSLERLNKAAPYQGPAMQTKPKVIKKSKTPKESQPDDNSEIF